MNNEKFLAAAKGAFIVRFRSPVDVAQGRLLGRAEHVASGQATHFETPEALLAFIRRVLMELRQEPQEEARPAEND